jgi:hypothetical protein
MDSNLLQVIVIAFCHVIPNHYLFFVLSSPDERTAQAAYGQFGPFEEN